MHQVGKERCAQNIRQPENPFSRPRRKRQICTNQPLGSLKSGTIAPHLPTRTRHFHARLF
ncbi:hypothetical protein GCWU000324_01473 [Kingella oralis ATCC 51147]|uniref:Uncharacterized protein n=1 Tax=Kingella oralis ATCC 51147 TaxID=629741 RepID=C4GKH0_9NEIS|nr:hypothetical protein GCWU000324_01473 [Kingella oralis ATCC 51147]